MTLVSNYGMYIESQSQKFIHNEQPVIMTRCSSVKEINAHAKTFGYNEYHK